MKRNYISLAATAAMVLLLSACEREKEINGYVPGENELAFRIGSISTRSAAEAVQEETTVIPFGNDGQGNQLFLEESMVDLNAPVTRGTPAYTENVWALYKSFAAYIPNSDDGTYSFKYDGTEGGSGYWTHAFGKDPWKAFESDPLELYMRMPEDMTSNGVSNLAYADGETTFSYTSPSTAQEQQDILFAYDSVKDSDYETGRDITFYHALTGVKFANFFSNPELTNDTQTFITKVTITGLVSGGTCVITPNATENKVVWTPGSSTGTFIQEYGTSDEVDFATGSGSFGDKGNYPSSFSSAGNNNNLNKSDGSLTFWFVPQELPSDATMTIEYKVVANKTSKEHTGSDTIKLGELLSGVTWKAGQLRTYTLKAQYVEIDIVDEMDDDKYVKSNVIVTNNGNVWEYVRVNIIGNWMGNIQTADNVYSDVNTILMGYTDDEKDPDGNYVNYTMTNPWNDKDFDADGNWASYLQELNYEAYGEFKDLPSMGTTSAGGTEKNNWIRHDKYYYFKTAIGPNESITKQLFTSYEVGPSPEFWIADLWGTRRKAGNVHLEMDLAVQAIPAPTDAAGNITEDYETAWKNALGVNNLNDL